MIIPILWFANLIGLATLPLSVWQFAFSRSKKSFLVLNFVSCLLWYVSLYLTHQYTAALVSLTAGIASLIQSFLVNRSHHDRALLSWIVALLAINTAVFIAPPTGLWSIVPVLIFMWVRGAEVFSEFPMRILVFISPIVWGVIAWHGKNYGLIPTEILAVVSMLWWFFQHNRKLRLVACGL